MFVGGRNKRHLHRTLLCKPWSNLSGSTSRRTKASSCFWGLNENVGFDCGRHCEPSRRFWLTSCLFSHLAFPVFLPMSTHERGSCMTPVSVFPLVFFVAYAINGSTGIVPFAYFAFASQHWNQPWMRRMFSLLIGWRGNGIRQPIFCLMHSRGTRRATLLTKHSRSTMAVGIYSYFHYFNKCYTLILQQSRGVKMTFVGPVWWKFPSFPSHWSPLVQHIHLRSTLLFMTRGVINNDPVWWIYCW